MAAVVTVPTVAVVPVAPPMIPVAAIVAVVAAILFTAILLIGAIAHVVAQRTTCTAAGGSADQAAGAAAELAPDDVATRCTQGAADGGLATLALVGTYGATRSAAQAGTDGRTGAAADGLADDRAEYPAQCAANAGFGGAAGHGCAAEQTE